MPSIPQSLLWISLVVLWLFVLVPMLISKRDAVRRTSDVALATRVLNTGRGARLLRRAASRGRTSQRSGLATVRGRPRRATSTRKSDDESTRTHGGAGSRRRGRERQRARLPRRRRRRRGLRRVTCRASPREADGRRGVEGAKPTRRHQNPASRRLGSRRRGRRSGRAGGRARARTRRHRRRVRVRRRFIGPGGAVGHRPAAGRLAERRAQAPVRVQDRRGRRAPASTSSASGC